jgi:RNA polymerase sigma-70 factor (ECF subfamily)
MPVQPHEDAPVMSAGHDAGGHRAAGIPDALREVYAQHSRFLWGLCYRMVGCAADADDIVQATFVRALEHPPARTDEPWRPWLTRVALNLGRDCLRRRRRQRYVGPWLPSPIETGDDESSLISYEPRVDGQNPTEGRYDLVESLSFAFLLALEVLTPKQRAVLLLRDVFDYSVAATADALGVSSGDVKTTHHRARRAMQGYDRERCRPTRELRERTQQALAELVSALATGDGVAVEALLADSVRALSDGAGEFFAARVPVVGRDRVVKFYMNVARGGLARARIEVRMLNGLPALVAEIDPKAGQAPRLVTAIELAADGRVKALHSVLATRKLTAVGPISG